MSRFSPEFAAKLRKKVGPDKHAFVRARRAFADWRQEFMPLVISPFIAHYINPARPDTADSGRDLTSEWYDSPFTHASYPIRPETEPEPEPEPEPESLVGEVEDRPEFRIPKLIRHPRVFGVWVGRPLTI